MIVSIPKPPETESASGDGRIRSASIAPRSGSEFLQQLVIVRVRADPEPDDLIAGANTERSIAEADRRRVDGTRGVHRLEAQARMRGVAREEPVGLAARRSTARSRLSSTAEPFGRPGLHCSSGSKGRVRPARCSASASSASLASASCEAARLDSHRRSAAISSRMAAASWSCSPREASQLPRRHPAVPWSCPHSLPWPFSSRLSLGATAAPFQFPPFPGEAVVECHGRSTTSSACAAAASESSLPRPPSIAEAPAARARPSPSAPAAARSPAPTSSCSATAAGTTRAARSRRVASAGS